MKNGMRQVLERFHREVFLPDFQRILDNAIEKSAWSLRREKSEYYGLKSRASYLDERLARIETEVQSMNGGDVAHVESELQFVKSHLRALEMLVDDIQKKIDRLATEFELAEIRQRIAILKDRIAVLETDENKRLAAEPQVDRSRRNGTFHRAYRCSF
jgi:chromosome segregation ATPase